MKMTSLQTCFRFSAVLYTLFLIPTVLWLLYTGSSDAVLSPAIGGAWQATFWHLPGLSNDLSRYVLDGFTWLIIAALTWLFWRGFCLLKAESGNTSSISIRRDVLCWTGWCAIILLAVIPFHSSDLYGYLNRGFQQSVFHTNPYLTPIADIPGWQNQPLLHAHWQYNPCPYGFFFAQWVKWIAQLSGPYFVSAFFLMKAINVVLLLGTTSLIADLAGRLGQEKPWLSAFLFGANPLVLLHVMGNGHNDVMMVFLLLLSLRLLCSKSWQWLTLPVLTLSVLVKYASLLAAPFVLVYMIRLCLWRPLILGGLLSVMIAAALAWPYVDPHQPWPWAALLDNAGKSQHSVPDMLARLIYYPAKWLHLGDAKAIMQESLRVMKPLFWAGFVVFYAWQGVQFLRKPHNLASLVFAIALTMTVMIAFVSAKFHPWYVVMFLPLVLVLPETSSSSSRATLILRRFGIWFSVFQIAGFTLLQNVHVLNVLLLTLLPLWLSLKTDALPCQRFNENC